jgi:cellulose biosynthesis protein BcsQ
MPTALDCPQGVPPNQKTYSQTERRKDDGTAEATAECVVIVLANHKGGVTKTTSTANLGAMLAELRRRVLLVEREVPELRILGVLLAATERRWRITRDASDRIEADGMRVLPVRIPRAVRVASAPRHRAPTALLEPEAMVSHAYRQVARLLLEELAG